MTTRELIDRYFDAVNQHRWTELESVFHPDVVIQHGMTLSTTGRAAAIKLLTAVVRQFDEHEDRPTRYLVDGTVAAVEIRFEGITRRGTPVAFDAVDFIDTDGAAITKVASWYDTAVVNALVKS